MKRLVHLTFSLTALCVMLAIAPNTTRAQRYPVVEDVIPDAMPMVDTGDDDVLTFLLFGTATSNPNNPGMTDMLMLVVVNRTSGSAAMLSIPRDLWVNIPGHGMNKITATYYLAETHGEDGVEKLKETVRYNLGVAVDHYAHVNFDGFLSIINTVGGIDISVDCVIQDWKLIEPDMDKHDPDSYEMHTLPIGIHTLDAHDALWYVRSRRTSSDIDRGRRQQDVLRAIWRKLRGSYLLTNLPAVWDQAMQSVDTDVTLPDVVGLLPLATSIDPNRIDMLRFDMGDHIRNALSPEPEYAAILAPNREGVITLVRELYTPPTSNQLARAGMNVQIVNASGVENLEYVAADRLAQEGFTPVIIEEVTHWRNYTSIYDYTGMTKGSPVPSLQKVLRVTDEGVITDPQATRETDIKIYLGNSYLFWSCTHNVIQPDPAEWLEDYDPGA